MPKAGAGSGAAACAFLSPCGRGCRRQERGAAQPLLSPPGRAGSKRAPLPNPLPQGERGPEAVVLQLQGSLSSANNCQRQELGAAQPRALSSPLAGEDAEGRRGGRRSRCFYRRAEPGANAPPLPNPLPQGERGPEAVVLQLQGSLSSANNCQRQAPGAAQPRALSSPLAGEDAEGRRGERRSRCCLSPSERREARGCIPRAHDISHPPSRR